jgi:hypothetical protein
MPLAKRNAAEEKSAMNETLAQLSVNSTERFDGKLTKHLQYQAPGLRSTMVTRISVDVLWLQWAVQQAACGGVWIVGFPQQGEGLN